MSELLNMVVSTIESHTGVMARWSGGKARLANPLRGTKDRNLLISDGDNRLRITDFSHGSDPKEVMEAVGMSIKDVFYESLSLKQRQTNQRAKSKQQIEDECVHAYLIISQLPAMKTNGIEPSELDLLSISKSLAVLEKYHFTEDDYFSIEERKQTQADERRLLACESALDDAYNQFLDERG